MIRMENKLTPKLKELKIEYDFLHKKIGELEWELATVFYGSKGVFSSEIDSLHERLDNYKENMEMLIEKIRDEVSKINKSK